MFCRELRLYGNIVVRLLLYCMRLMSDAINTCVIFNPTSGRGRAQRALEEARRFHAADHEFRATCKPGDAELIAIQAIRDGFGKVVAAGGDGTVHEVANGILRAGNPDVLLGVWPFGSANDYACALGITGDPQQPRAVQNVDVGLVEGPPGRQRFFVNGLGIGFNGAVTVEARKIGWLRGMPLYGLAILRAMLWHFHKPTMRLRFDDRECETPTLGLTLNLGKREGGFPLTPAADLSDGMFDYMHAGPVGRWELLRHFPNMIRGTLPTDHPRMWQGRCRRLQVNSESPLRIHVDGEFFCHSEDGIHEIDVTLLPRWLRVEQAADSSVHSGRPA